MALSIKDMPALEGQTIGKAGSTNGKKRYTPAYYARKKYAGSGIVDWSKISC